MSLHIDLIISEFFITFIQLALVLILRSCDEGGLRIRYDDV